jgi:DNA-directed RNA polymerase subunit RPC12/RpoP
MNNIYRAIMPCPVCHSVHTTVKLTYGAKETDVKSVWTCAICGKKFEPPKYPQRVQVLVCEVCGPNPHTLTADVQELIWRDPVTVRGKKPTRFGAEVWSCNTCLHTRTCGVAWVEGAHGGRVCS